MPFPFYNVNPPTPSTKNNITNIAIGGIRDFLLNKNLGVNTGGLYPQISTSINGSPRIGEPVLDTMIGTGNVTQPFGLPLETEGVLRMQLAVASNKYRNISSTANDIQNINYILPTPNNFPNSTQPNGIDSYPDNINLYGLEAKTVDAGLRKKATLMNLYLDADSQIDTADWIGLNVAPLNKQIKGYLDVYGNLNVDNNTTIQASNIIGSVLNGQGLGLAKGGVITNFDLRASLAGRVLGSNGTINDTRLGVIGGQQLAFSLANNAAFNVEQTVLGTLNAQDNILSLVKNGTLVGFRPDYKITVPSSDIGFAADYTARILGFTLPKSYLSDAGSIFQNENGDAENVSRANSMILNTGKGQVMALLNNITANLSVNSLTGSTFRTGYAPAFKDNKGQDAITNGILYAFDNGQGHLVNPLLVSDGIVPDMNYLREGKVDQSGFSDIGSSVNYQKTGPFGANDFTWGSALGGNVNSIGNFDIGTADRKSLLHKTQKLFNSRGMKNIISAKGDMGISSSQIQSTNGGGISHGSAVLAGNSFNNDGLYTTTFSSATETYCRSWSTFSRYQQVNNLIRSRGLDSYTSTDGTQVFRNITEGSVLDDNGIVKISPYGSDKADDPKKYMFSIENLAWNEEVSNLLPCEVGPGDLISGIKGRIMWFPPYDIQFNENTSVNWETNNFIGRGEPIYTYNNTERSGNISFKLIVDHPSYINSFSSSKGSSVDDNYVASYFAGCVEPSPKFADKLSITELSQIASANAVVPQIKTDTSEVPPDSFNFYYPNDYSDVLGTIDIGYENGLSGASPSDEIDYSVYTSGYGIGPFAGGGTSPTVWDDNYNYGLNGWPNSLSVDGQSFSGFSDPNFASALSTYLDTKCPHCVATITSYASPQGNAIDNQKLADNRTASMIAYLMSVNKNLKIKKGNSIVLSSSDCVNETNAPTDTFACKVDRRTTVTFEYDPQLSGDKISPQPVNNTNTNATINQTIKNRFYNECSYFEKLTQNDYFIFDKFREKIKYFHPAFHSTTPEGFNARLTFLQQCTRQGKTHEEQGANNLAFGRAPVCILRIGDFFNTKVIIDSIAVDYEPLVWDLNPEGIGVQPMIANVNLSFKFIGGSTLAGPLQKLQNALSFNYYANTHVYDVRADYISKDVPITSNTASPQSTLSKNGYFINNNFNPSTYNKTTETSTMPQQDINNNTPTTDQNKACDITNGPLTPQTNSNTNSGTPITTGVDIFNVASDNTNWNIELMFKMDNITNVGPDNSTATSNWNVNISLSNTLGNIFKQISITNTLFVDSTDGSRGTVSFSISDFPSGFYVLKIKIGDNPFFNKSINLN